MLWSGVAGAQVAAQQPSAASPATTQQLERTVPAASAELDATQDIVVTGIRASLDRSIAIKRESNGIVDAISAEDIGKFPNTNLAESLQRIPGVSINRVNGEGSQVTVRGFGPGYNLVTLNGRTLASSDITSSGGGSRSFNFDNLASEGVQTLEVYKSGRAAVPSGGIGATINVATRKPLGGRESGFNGSLGARAMYDTSTDDCVDCGSKVTPELNGFLSWANDADTFGVSLFGSYQRRNFTTQTASAGGWNIIPYSSFLNFTNANTQIENAPTDPNALVGVPDSATAVYSRGSRTRINGYGTAQFKPTETLTFTADALFAQQDQHIKTTQEGNWFNRPFDIVRFDENNVIPTTVYLHETNRPAKDLSLGQTDNQVRNRLQDYGLNAKLEATDRLMLSLDGHWSKSSSGPNDRLGRGNTTINLGGYGTTEHDLTLEDGVIRQSFSFNDTAADGSARQGNRNGVLDAGDVGSTIGSTSAVRQTQVLKEVRFDGAWTFDDDSRIDFGGNYRDSDVHLVSRSTIQTLGDWGINRPGDVEQYAPGALKAFCLYCKFKNTDLQPTGDALTAFYSDSPYDLYDAISNGYSALGQLPTVNGSGDNRVKEKIWAAYGQFSWAGRFAGMDAKLVAGMRYERTTTEAVTFQLVPQGIRWESDADFLVLYSDEQQSVSDKGNYDNLLPSMDFQVSLKQNLVGRVSFSRTLARTDYSNLFAVTNVGQPNRPIATGGVATASSGNPRLQPLLSDNFDVSLEWYIKPGSYLSVGFFDKRVRNFVGNGVTDRSLFGLRDVTSGAPGTRSGDARAALQAIGADVNDANMFVMTALIDQRGSAGAATPEFLANYDPASRSLSQAYVDQINTAYNILPDDRDPLLTYSVSQPINTREAKLWGFEFAGSYFFGNTGFGIAAQYTLVRGDVGFDVAADPTIDQFALLGLSDTANVTAIYDKHGLSARLSYNWRDRYLAATNVDSYRNPNFVKPVGQLDASISYDITPQIAVSLEGINLTNEGQGVYGRTSSQIYSLQDLYRRFVAGVRFRF